MLAPAAIITRCTVWPLMSMPRISPARCSASSAERAILTPPALPRPPVFTCALTTTTPVAPSAPSRVSAAARASEGVVATIPPRTGTPCRSKMSRAWYSNRSTCCGPSLALRSRGWDLAALPPTIVARGPGFISTSRYVTQVARESSICLDTRAARQPQLTHDRHRPHHRLRRRRARRGDGRRPRDRAARRALPAGARRPAGDPAGRPGPRARLVLAGHRGRPRREPPGRPPEAPPEGLTAAPPGAPRQSLSCSIPAPPPRGDDDVREVHRRRPRRGRAVPGDRPRPGRHPHLPRAPRGRGRVRRRPGRAGARRAGRRPGRAARRVRRRRARRRGAGGARDRPGRRAPARGHGVRGGGAGPGGPGSAGGVGRAARRPRRARALHAGRQEDARG